MDFKDVTSTMGKQGEDKEENVCSQKPRSVSPSQNPGHPKKCIHKKRFVKRFWREYETLVPFGKPTQQKEIYCFQMHFLQKKWNLQIALSLDESLTEKLRDVSYHCPIYPFLVDTLIGLGPVGTES